MICDDIFYFFALNERFQYNKKKCNYINDELRKQGGVNIVFRKNIG